MRTTPRLAGLLVISILVLFGCAVSPTQYPTTLSNEFTPEDKLAVIVFFNDITFKKPKTITATPTTYLLPISQSLLTSGKEIFERQGVTLSETTYTAIRQINSGSGIHTILIPQHKEFLTELNDGAHSRFMAFFNAYQNKRRKIEFKRAEEDIYLPPPLVEGEASKVIVLLTFRATPDKEDLKDTRSLSPSVNSLPPPYVGQSATEAILLDNHSGEILWYDKKEVEYALNNQSILDQHLQRLNRLTIQSVDNNQRE